jgi:hypothetical protein
MDTNSTFIWVKSTFQYYSFLIRLALRLILQLINISPCQMPYGALHLRKKVLFVYILEVLLEGPQKGFFNLPKISQKAKKQKKH